VCRIVPSVYYFGLQIPTRRRVRGGSVGDTCTGGATEDPCAGAKGEPSREQSGRAETVGTESFFEKHSTNAHTHTRMSTHPYEHIHAHPIPISTFERLSRLDFELHEVGHQEHLTVNGDVASH
jgi:hypothetical protein